MRVRKVKYPHNVQRLIEDIIESGGCKSVTLERVFKDTPFGIRCASRPVLSLDLPVRNKKSDYAPQTIGDFLEAKDIVEPKIKTIYDEIHEMDILALIKKTRKQIKQDWHKVNQKRGMKTALKVFDGLCQDDTNSEIAREVGITRQAVDHVKKQLAKVPAVKKLKKELRLMSRDY